MTTVETPEQYKERLASYVKGRDPVELQRQSLRTITELVTGAPASLLKERPGPTKWSVVEIVAHLAEDEFVSSWRYRQMLEHETPLLEGFDQDLWATLGRYETWPQEDALSMFRLLREANLRMFSHLNEAQWNRDGIHAERGRITVRGLCEHTAAHDVNHLEQIKRILAR